VAETQALMSPVLKKSTSSQNKYDQQVYYCQCNTTGNKAPRKSIDYSLASRQPNTPYKISVTPQPSKE